jgi:hypothetical protein
MIFGVAVWSFEENDLYLVQDVYEGHAGSGGIVDLRVLRKSKQPAKLPLESVLTHG